MSTGLRITVLCSLLLQGCLSIVLDQAKITGELPLVPPAVVPESAPEGSLHGQLAVRVSEELGHHGGKIHWNSYPLAGDGQIQWVMNRHLRFLAGGSLSPSGVSGWAGPVFSTQDRLLRWDIELLAGTSPITYELEGRVVDSEDDETGDFTRSGGEVRRSWGQCALRARALESGPWGEVRIVPALYVGSLADPRGRIEPYDVIAGALSVGGGWIQEFRGGTLILVGGRSTLFAGSWTPSFVLSVQRPLR